MKTMQTEKTTMKCESVYSEDKAHRILLRREWDKMKEAAMVIMINPSETHNVQMDLTAMCVINNLDRLNIGAVDIFNMYSRMTNKISFRFHDDEELLIPENDEYMKKSAERVNCIILAWGQIGQNNKRVRQRQQEILIQLAPYADKIRIIKDKEGRKGLHPLTPQIRNQWILEKITIQELQILMNPPEASEKPKKEEPDNPPKVAEEISEASPVNQMIEENQDNLNIDSGEAHD